MIGGDVTTRLRERVDALRDERDLLRDALDKSDAAIVEENNRLRQEIERLRRDLAAIDSPKVAWAKLGARSLYQKLTPEERSEKARRAALARHGKLPPGRARVTNHRRKWYGEAVCTVCGLIAPINSYGNVISHWPNEPSHAFEGNPTYYCRGSNRKPRAEASA